MRRAPSVFLSFALLTPPAPSQPSQLAAARDRRASAARQGAQPRCLISGPRARRAPRSKVNTEEQRRRPDGCSAAARSLPRCGGRGSAPWPRMCQPPRRTAWAPGACTAASSSGERPGRLPTRPGFEVRAGRRSGPVEWKRWCREGGETSLPPLLSPGPGANAQCEERPSALQEP